MSSADAGPNAGFGIYLHWPFCEAKCPYCDFNSHVSSRIDQGEWRTAYLAEIERYAAQTQDRIVNSVFFGGGTPSLMEPRLVGDILDAITRHWRMGNDVEITLEANPSSVEADRFAGYRAAGVNRVSLGVQALNDGDLKRLGRLHSAIEARRAMDIARNTFDRVSFDLIYARQDQSLADWEAELKEALAVGMTHMSLYQLTIEPGTAFGFRHAKGGLKGLPSDDLSADMFEVTQEICEAAGLPMYEVSNYATEPEQSRHNLTYWRYGEYVGIGPGAHGRLKDEHGQRWATETHLAPAAWLSAVSDGCGESGRSALDPADQGTEYLLMCLRLREGISKSRYKALSGTALNPNAIAKMVDLGAIIEDEDKLSVSNQYISVMNTVAAELLQT